MRRLALVVLLALAGPAQALDCSKASTKAEKAICADPTARAANDDLNKAFAAAILLMSPSDKASAAAAQARWIDERDANCGDAGERSYARCLAQQSARRRAFLAAEPEAGPGAPGRLAPAFREEKGDKRKASLNLQWLKYPAPATPAERAFNAALERDVGPLDQPGADDVDDQAWGYERGMRLVYASPRLISAQLEGYNATGGVHPTSFTAEINILVEEGREANFADLVDAAAAQKLIAFCLNSVRAQRTARLDAHQPPEDRLTADALPKRLAEATADLRNWSFGADAATVDYDANSVGAPYAQGDWDCVIPYAMLKPLARPGFPLPQ